MKSVTVHDVPKAKPRMTQRDKWQQRPSVCAYRLWKDRVAWEVRTAGLREPVSWVELIFYLPKPAHALPSDRHTTKPDLDNLIKGVFDSVTRRDQTISRIFAEKRYDDGAGCRLELRWGEALAERSRDDEALLDPAGEDAVSP